MEQLKLGHTKPLAFIKVQTTGMDFKKDRIIEISVTRVETDGKRKTGTRLVNPEMPIPAEATKINNITDAMVKDKPVFKDIAEGMVKFLEGCDIVGFSIESFDLKFLGEEFNKAGVEFLMMGRKVVDISKIYHAMEARDLAAAYNFYCDKKMPEKSGSENVTNTYFEIVNKMFEKYNGQEYKDREENVHVIEPTVESVHKVFNKNQNKFDISGFIVSNEQGRPIFTKGKYNGKLVSESMINDTEYYDWLVNASDFAMDTKIIVRKIVEKAKNAALTK